MWELDHEETWALKNWCFWTVVLEKTLEIPLDYKEIQPVNPKGNQSWIFTGRTDAEAETPIFWPPDLKKRTWCWERLKAGGDGDYREWDGLMSSPTQWTWVWVSSRSWWSTGKPGMLQFVWYQRFRHYWVTELNWVLVKYLQFDFLCFKNFRPRIVLWTLLILSGGLGSVNFHWPQSVFENSLIFEICLWENILMPFELLILK